ncbi:hypothetical protein ACR76M_09840 [Enterococcus innesii]|uniref:hypothetical protein n=1 Tax=Enterococcus innesii TaxID=2839759 RepID=UPI003B5A2E76
MKKANLLLTLPQEEPVCVSRKGRLLWKMIEVAGLSKEINGRKTIDQLTFLVLEYRWSYYF